MTGGGCDSVCVCVCEGVCVWEGGVRVYVRVIIIIHKGVH